MLCGIASRLPFWFLSSSDDGLGAGVERQVSPFFLNISLVSAVYHSNRKGEQGSSYNP